MSCGQPHEVSCREVLDKVFEFLDSEVDERSSSHIAQHLDECGPCLQLFGIEREIKALVHRKCGGDPAPAGLRERIRLKLHLVAVDEGYRSETTFVRESSTARDSVVETTVQTTYVRQVSGPLDSPRDSSPQLRGPTA